MRWWRKCFTVWQAKFWNPHKLTIMMSLWSLLVPWWNEKHKLNLSGLLLKGTRLRNHHPNESLSMKLSNRWTRGQAPPGLHLKEGDLWLPPQTSSQTEMGAKAEPAKSAAPTTKALNLFRRGGPKRRGRRQTLRDSLDLLSFSHSSRFPINLKALAMPTNWSEHWRCRGKSSCKSGLPEIRAWLLCPKNVSLNSLLGTKELKD